MSLFSVTFHHEKTGQDVEVNLDWIVVPILAAIILVFVVAMVGCSDQVPKPPPPESEAVKLYLAGKRANDCGEWQCWSDECELARQACRIAGGLEHIAEALRTQATKTRLDGGVRFDRERTARQFDDFARVHQDGADGGAR